MVQIVTDFTERGIGTSPNFTSPNFGTTCAFAQDKGRLDRRKASSCSYVNIYQDRESQAKRSKRVGFALSAPKCSKS
jgi:hypothetical protein